MNRNSTDFIKHQDYKHNNTIICTLSFYAVGVDNECLLQNVHWWRDTDREIESGKRAALRHFLIIIYSG